MNYLDVKRIYESNFTITATGERVWRAHIGLRWDDARILIEQQAPKHLRKLTFNESIGEPMANRVNVVLDSDRVMAIFWY